jgi:hypothetical protein
VKKPDVDAAYRDSAAARLLAAGLANAANEHGLSQRSLARQLGYKQSVVLSHMALGRVPIPLERAAQFADLLKIDRREFLLAVLEQRLPDVDWSEIASSGAARSGAGELVTSLEAIAGGALDNLNSEQKFVMREVARDRYASERWLSVHEVPTVAQIRSLRPTIGTNGLSAEDHDAIRTILAGPPDETGHPSIF